MKGDLTPLGWRRASLYTWVGKHLEKKKKKLRTLKSEKYSIFIHTNILHRKILTFKVNKLTYGMP